MRIEFKLMFHFSDVYLGNELVFTRTLSLKRVCADLFSEKNKTYISYTDQSLHHLECELARPLTFNLKQLETHRRLFSTVATDALVLKHQAISTRSVDDIHIMCYSSFIPKCSIRSEQHDKIKSYQWDPTLHLAENSFTETVLDITHHKMKMAYLKIF